MTPRDPGSDPLLTVRVYPDDDPADRGAIRYLRTDGPNFPWVPITGRPGSFTTLPVRSDAQVEEWPVQAFGDVLAALSGEMAG